MSAKHLLKSHPHPTHVEGIVINTQVGGEQATRLPADRTKKAKGRRRGAQVEEGFELVLKERSLLFFSPKTYEFI